MNRRTLCALSLLVASAVASPAIHASPVAMHAPVHAMFAKSKLVKFNLRNDGAAALTLKVGDGTMIVDAGKTASVELPVGTRILLANATATREAGSLVTEVSKNLSGSTIALKG